MITAIIRNKENTLILELPHSIYDIYEKLQSIGIMQPPKQIPLTDNEDENIGVKLFSESDFGQHLLLTLNEKNTIADANMLTLVIGAASEDIKEELEQNILYDQYDSMDEVINAVRQMTQDAGPVPSLLTLTAAPSLRSCPRRSPPQCPLRRYCTAASILCRSASLLRPKESSSRHGRSTVRSIR